MDRMLQEIPMEVDETAAPMDRQSHRVATPVSTLESPRFR